MILLTKVSQTRAVSGNWEWDDMQVSHVICRVLYRRVRRHVTSGGSYRHVQLKLGELHVQFIYLDLPSNPTVHCWCYLGSSHWAEFYFPQLFSAFVSPNRESLHCCKRFIMSNQNHSDDELKEIFHMFDKDGASKLVFLECLYLDCNADYDIIFLL